MLAGTSKACGEWQANCVLDPESGLYVNSIVSQYKYDNPDDSTTGGAAGVGTFGSYTVIQTIFTDSRCGAGAIAATVSRFGEWQDLGPVVRREDMKHRACEYL